MQLAFTTVDELFLLLEQAGEALDYREIFPRLFPVSNASPELVRALVADIVHSDERFAWEGDLHIGLAHWKAQRRDLADVVYTVVDLETTGATPGFAKITEIGAVRVVDGEQTATFSQLVNPGVPIPAMITSITGIDDLTVAEAPPIEDVLPRFVEFSADSVLVAHNARFDLAFLDYELGKLLGCTFQRPDPRHPPPGPQALPPATLLARRTGLSLRHAGRSPSTAPSRTPRRRPNCSSSSSHGCRRKA